MRRSLALIATFVVALGLTGVAAAVRPATPTTPAPAPSAPAAKSWADPQIRIVTAAGILGDDPATVPTRRPADPRRAGGRTRRLGEAGPDAADPTRLVTIRELDAQLVGALGLFAGRPSVPDRRPRCRLGPTSMIGTETVARLLGLRLDHPGKFGRTRAAAFAARDSGRGGLLARPSPEAHERASRLARPAEPDLLVARARGVAASRARAGASVRRLPVRLGRRPRRLRSSGAAMPPADSRPFPGASTARASSGGSTRRSRSRAPHCSVTSSRAGRPTR